MAEAVPHQGVPYPPYPEKVRATAAPGPVGVPLVDLLDRVLATGVVVDGDLVLGIADVPLVRLSLRALLSSVNERVPSPWGIDGGNR